LLFEAWSAQAIPCICGFEAFHPSWFLVEEGLFSRRRNLVEQRSLHNDFFDIVVADAEYRAEVLLAVHMSFDTFRLACRKCHKSCAVLRQPQ
jgi:hypothetical protein